VPDVEFDVGLQLIASLETVATKLAAEEHHRQKKAQAIRQIPLAANQAALTAGAGTIDDPAQLRCPTGYYMGIRRLTLSGFTAGTAVVYLNSTSGEPAVPFGQAGSSTFGKGQLLLHPGDRLVVSATGITGVVQLNGAADLLESWYLPYYLG
jgi:hypothetical protein